MFTSNSLIFAFQRKMWKKALQNELLELFSSVMIWFFRTPDTCQPECMSLSYSALVETLRVVQSFHWSFLFHLWFGCWLCVEETLVMCWYQKTLVKHQGWWNVAKHCPAVQITMVSADVGHDLQDHLTRENITFENFWEVVHKTFYAVLIPFFPCG